jgi:membrane associated rhomboid family serine protease
MVPVRDHLPTRSVAGVNYALIGMNVAIFGLEVLLAAGGADTGGSDSGAPPLALVPAQFIAHPLANLSALFAHMFLHGSVAHLGGNMLFLWIFGDNVEDALSHVRYAVFYVACGLAAAAAQIAVNPQASVPMVGASGAISGVLAAYAVLYPRTRITVVNPIPIMWFFWGLFIWLPAWFVIVEWFAANLWNAFQPSSATGGVAFMAHVGGFVAGLILLPLLRAREAVEYDPWERFLGPRLRRAQ